MRMQAREQQKKTQIHGFSTKSSFVLDLAKNQKKNYRVMKPIAQTLIAKTVKLLLFLHFIAFDAFTLNSYQLTQFAQCTHRFHRKAFFLSC